jgi:hypothetical protein
VRVKSREAIRATLDASGALDGLQYMEEMAGCSGRIYRVHRRVDKINDMRHKTGLRRMRDAVTLTGVHCSGAYHGGCQAECQTLWKDAWLEKLPFDARVETHGHPQATRPAIVEIADAGRSFDCQMTRLWEASSAMSPFDIRQDIRPLLSGNIGLRAYAIAMLTRAFNAAQALRGGNGYPRMPAVDSVRDVAPVAGRKAGDAVVVKTKREIAQTLHASRHRGLWFDREMVRSCGQPAVVHSRVERIIHEANGRMVVLRTPCVSLKNAVATGESLRLCPQHEYPLWHEIWLADASERR